MKFGLINTSLYAMVCWMLIENLAKLTMGCAKDVTHFVLGILLSSTKLKIR